MIKTDYTILKAQAEALIDGVPHFTANLANIAALLYDSLADINWAGFYLTEGNQLVLGPFQGKPACVVIPWGKGVCGTAALKNETQLIPNVHEFSGHIACDSASNSEIVIPLRKNGEVVGVIDIDSPSFSRFSENDKTGLEALAALLERTVFA